MSYISYILEMLTSNIYIFSGRVTWFVAYDLQKVKHDMHMMVNVTCN